MHNFAIKLTEFEVGLPDIERGFMLKMNLLGKGKGR